MLRVLLRKQMLEINRSIFTDRKTGKRKTKSGVVTSLVLFGLVTLLLAGSFFALGMLIGDAFFEANLDWMYFLIMGGVAILMGVFGCVFNTYSTLFLAKDNDMLLSMPIPVKYILISRLMGVYIMGLVYSGMVALPMLLVYYIIGSPSWISVLTSILFAVLISLIVFVLSCLLGYIVAKISTRLRNKSFVIVIISLLFIAAYYYVYFNAEQLITSMVGNGANIAEQLKVWAYPFYALANVAVGDGWSILITIAIVAVLLLFSLWLLNRSFLKIATTTTNGRSKQTGVPIKESGIRRAMLKKELRRFGSSAVYMLNCGLGSFFMIVASVVLLIKMNDLAGVGAMLASEGYDIIAVMGMAALMMMASSNDITAPSISLEGKNLWIIKSLPISEWHILRAKIDLHITITLPCVIVAGICTSIALGLGWLVSILIVIVAIIFTYVSAMFGLMLNLKFPYMVWTNESVPVKQSFAVTLSIFAGWIYSAALAGLYIAVRSIIPPVWYLVICLAINAVLAVLLYRYLKTRGIQRFREL